MKLKGTHIVSLVAGVCLISLIAILKNVLHIKSEILSQQIILFIIVYGGFVFLNQTTQEKQKSKDRPFIWSGIIIFITLAIVGLYAIK